MLCINCKTGREETILEKHHGAHIIPCAITNKEILKIELKLSKLNVKPSKETLKYISHFIPVVFYR